MFPNNLHYFNKVSVVRRVTVAVLWATFIIFPIEASLSTDFIKENRVSIFFITPLQQQHAYAQILFNPNNNSSIIVDGLTASNNSNTSDTKQDTESSIVKASGHFANNQIKSDTVSWIQGGKWGLEVKNMNNNNKNNTERPNLTAIFDANFTIIKSNQISSGYFSIKNFSSTNVIYSNNNNDVAIMGMTDIHSDNEIKYNQVAVTIYLLSNKVLHLTIDGNNTIDGIANNNKLDGTFIMGIGLEDYNASSAKPVYNRTSIL